MAGLTAKQQRFVEEYICDLNATQAAIRAGYSAKNADKIGSELLGKTRVREALQAVQAARSKRTEITADRVLEQLAKIAFADIKDVVKFGPHGVTIVDCEQVDGTILAEISETRTEAGGSQKVKLNDRMKALELIGRHLGMYTDKLEHTGKNGGPLQYEVLSDEEIDAKIARLKGE